MPVLENTTILSWPRPGGYRVELERLDYKDDHSEGKTHPILFPFQERAVSRISDKEAAVIFASSGIGKTFMAIEAAGRALRANEVDRVLVLTASMLTTFWTGEIAKMVPNDKAGHVTGATGERDRSYVTSEGGWLVVPYSVLLNDVGVLEHLAASSYLVFDTVSRVGGPQSRHGVAANTLSRVAPKRLGLMSPNDLRDFSRWEALMSLVLDPKGKNADEVHAAANAARGGASGDLAVLTVASL